MARNPIDHLVYAPGRGTRCGHAGCAAKADNYARCLRCDGVIARCCYHGPAFEKRDSHCGVTR
ncbi:MAG: hypothetical protein KBD62_35995 [Kofleriaceae bacterium]|nr:hypothetical protein [Kofleriaceae bacterium]